MPTNDAKIDDLAPLQPQQSDTLVAKKKFSKQFSCVKQELRNEKST